MSDDEDDDVTGSGSYFVWGFVGVRSNAWWSGRQSKLGSWGTTATAATTATAGGVQCYRFEDPSRSTIDRQEKENGFKKKKKLEEKQKQEGDLVDLYALL